MNSTSRLLFIVLLSTLITLSTQSLQRPTPTPTPPSNNIWVKQETFNEPVCEFSSSMGGSLINSGVCFLGRSLICNIETGVVTALQYSAFNCAGTPILNITYNSNQCLPSIGVSTATSEYTCYNSFPSYPESSLVSLIYQGQKEQLLGYNWVPANKCYKDWYVSGNSMTGNQITATSGSASSSGSSSSGSGFMLTPSGSTASASSASSTTANPTSATDSNGSGSSGGYPWAQFNLYSCKTNQTYDFTTYANGFVNSGTSGSVMSSGKYSTGYPVPPTGSGSSTTGSGSSSDIHGACSMMPNSAGTYNNTNSYSTISNTYTVQLCFVDLN